MRYVSAVLLTLWMASASASTGLPETIKQIKPAIVGIGIHTPNGRPQNVLNGTGFAIGNGQYVVTNYHVVPKDALLDGKKNQVIFTGTGTSSNIYNATVIAYSQVHDLAILKHDGPPLPVMELSTDTLIDEGSDIAFTGFPIGAVLGLYPVTHKGSISSVTPVVVPASDAKTLSPSVIRALKNPYLVYQLDATAYPGNSGSPVYDQATGVVIAVINKVMVQATKEAAITNPSGITYAIPIHFLSELVQKSDLDINQ